MNESFKRREINGGQVLDSKEEKYQLIIPESKKKRYTLAQIDNYMHLSRVRFPYEPPVKMRLEARARDDFLGTFGFGFWNDPFSLGLGPAGMSKLLPVLPNAAWFFYASEENYLSLRDTLPGSGFHVKTFSSPLLPSFLSVFSLVGLPFLFIRPAARMIRKLLRMLVHEDAKRLSMSCQDWHSYSLVWEKDVVLFKVDDSEILKTSVSPKGKLGLVIWIDNQFFCFDSRGILNMGFLPTPTQQVLEISHLTIGCE